MAVALLGGPHGNRGEVLAAPLSWRLDGFRPGAEFRLAGAQGYASGSKVVLERFWERRGRAILKFQGIDTISGAERLRGGELQIPLSERPQPPEGEYYESDLVGCEVRGRPTGKVLGCVRELREVGGPPLLVIEEAGGGELLAPFARSICVEIDPANKRILVDLPDGLRDLNR